MINYIELILFIILLVLMQDKPEFLIHYVSNPIINIIVIGLIAFIAKTQSLSAGILIALQANNLNEERKFKIEQKTFLDVLLPCVCYCSFRENNHCTKEQILGVMSVYYE